MTTLKQILEREGLDYECLTELVREWLQQKQSPYGIPTAYTEGKLDMLRELLEELDK